jgi:hypothetical protein
MSTLIRSIEVVRRIDAFTLVSLDAFEVTGDGFELYDARFARTGLQDYGDHIEFRPDAEVFDADSLASYELRPLSDLHPPKNIDAKTARMLARGATGKGERGTDGIHVVGRLAVWDADLQAKFAARRKAGQPMQLSAGYTLELQRTPGRLADGRRYDAIQTKIRINHVAAVPLGRAGSAQVLDAGQPWALDPREGWVLDAGHTWADIAPHRSRVIVDMAPWCRHDAADLREQLQPQLQDSPSMKKITINIDGKPVVVEFADNATEQQQADAIAKAVAEARKPDTAADAAKRQAEFDAAVKAAADKAVREALAPLLSGPAPAPQADAAAVKAQFEKQLADERAHSTASATARAALGLSYDAAGKTPAQINLDVIERAFGADERKAIEADAGAIPFMLGRALKKIEADGKRDHAGELLREIQQVGQGGKRTDGKADPHHEQRDAATERAAMTPSERAAYDAQRKAG